MNREIMNSGVPFPVELFRRCGLRNWPARGSDAAPWVQFVWPATEALVAPAERRPIADLTYDSQERLWFAHVYAPVRRVADFASPALAWEWLTGVEGFAASEGDVPAEARLW